MSGSPTHNANTDKLVRRVIESTGEEYEFIKLSGVNIGPCTACMDCVLTNECSIEDDFKIVGDKVLRADALVVGSPVYYGTVSAFTKAFMERLYAFRHLKLLTKDKVAAAIGVGAASEDNATEWLSGVMMFAGMDVVGTLNAKGTICCQVCGVGERCAYATWNAYCEEFAGEDFGVEENYEGFIELLPDNVPYRKGSARILQKYRDVEEEPKVMEQAALLGDKVKRRLERQRMVGMR